MRARAVIGTAGHVDHGKTTLVRELTGIDTDRLPEEKARGISIELGFAWLDRPDGRIAFVDVPGHERFVRQMIAGAAGMDAVLLVVAADEGVMPQTREHLDVCRLLRIERGAVVITKRDRVDDEWLALVHDDVAVAVRGTFLEGAPVVTFAAGQGTDAVVRVVDALVHGLPPRARSDRPFALPIDRAFTRPGFGTIVTGTTLSGRVAVDDEVVLQPHGVVARVRGLEAHGEPVTSSGPGMRVAVNLAGVELDEVSRSGLLVHRDGPQPVSMIDATFTAIDRLPLALEDGEKGLVHLGTERVEATLALLDGPAEPGVEVMAQLRLAQSVAFVPGTPYVLRGFRSFAGRHDLGLTLGGGLALAPGVRRLRRGDGASVRALAEVGSALVSWIGAHGESGVARAELARALPFDRAALDRAVAQATSRGEVLLAGGRAWARTALVHLDQAIRDGLATYHREHPDQSGARVDELRTRVRPSASPELFELVLTLLAREKKIVRREHEVHAVRFVPIAVADDALCAALIAKLEATGLTPPLVADLPTLLAVREPVAKAAIERTIKDGRALRVTPELVFARAALAELEANVRAYFVQHERMDAQALKELTGASRKFSIPLGEWLDRARITVRVGDERRLRA